MKTFIPLMVTFLALISCQPGIEDSQEDGPVTYQNIVVLLDLSDRILNQPDQAEKDLKVLTALLELFSERQKQFGFLISEDRLTIQSISQSEINYSTFQFKDSLQLDMGIPTMNAPLFKEKVEQLKRCLNRLYQQAKEQETAAGADLWTDMRDKVPDLLRNGDSSLHFENKLIILTDGYLALEKRISSKRSAHTCMIEAHLRELRSNREWKDLFIRKKMGLSPHIGVNYRNLQTMVLEVCPESPEINTNEMSMVEHYWEDWFEKMGMKIKLHPSQNNPDQNKIFLSEFLQNP